jgi:hypothetical protein
MLEYFNLFAEIGWIGCEHYEGTPLGDLILIISGMELSAIGKRILILRR